MIKFAVTGLCLSLSVLFYGCSGYQIGDVKPSAYKEVNRIFVPVFKNQTLEPRISALVTNSIIKELQVDGTYEITNRANADAILVGSIDQISKRQLRSVRFDTTRSRELSLMITASYHLEDPSGKKITGLAPVEPRNNKSVETLDRIEQAKIQQEVIRASPGRVRGETIQPVDTSFQVGERNAIAVAAEDLAKNLVDQLSEGW